jgi:toxin YoeB
MKAIKFDPEAFKEYLKWREDNTNTFDRINQVIMDAARDPFKGIGKPEPLKGNFRGYWSRRITAERRLIYKVENDTLIIAKCHGHYD